MTPKIDCSRQVAQGNARNRAAASIALFGLGLMLSLPVEVSAQEVVDIDQRPTGWEQPHSTAIGASISDGIFRDQLTAEQGPDRGMSGSREGSIAAVGCAAILAGPRRDQALSSGDCADLGGGELLLDSPVTVTLEPTTLAMLILPASLILLSLVNFRRTRQRA